MNAWSWGRGDIERKPIPPEVQALVERRQGGRFCVDCRRLGLVTPQEIPLELDHRQPLSKGGDNHHLNLEFRCRSHNRGRCDRELPGEVPPRPAWERKRVRIEE